MYFRPVIQSAGLAVAACVATLVVPPTAEAAYVHTLSIPAGVAPTFSKSTHPFMYLEAENVERNATDIWDNPNDSIDTSGDQARTFNRNDGNPSANWSGGVSYNNNRFGSYGGDVTLTNINAYWTNLSTGLPEGTYDVFIRAFPGGGSQTYTLYAGADRAAVDAGTAIAGPVTTTTSGAEGWYKLGVVDVTAGMDTFRLHANTTTSSVRFDTNLFAGQATVPEPSMGLLGLAGGLAALGARRRSQSHA